MTETPLPASAAPADATETPVSDVMRRVGARVRMARAEKGLPRRALSEASGVSARYLAQLEAGQGNISIALLERVAVALGRRLEWLIGSDPAVPTEAARVAELYRAAPAAVQAQVLQLLAPGEVPDARRNRICLVGLRGAGKSTLGTRAGAVLGLPFVELNREIEEQSGMPVGEVMALYGQEGYRRLEAQAVARVIRQHDALILAVAGGIVADTETYGELLAHFHTIWVRTSPDEHMARVRAQGDERPMAGNPEAMEQLKSILTDREELYARAEAQLDTSRKTTDASLQDLLALIEERGFLSTP
ncbi:helix-turn-helix transcriptional regulator [Chachezhania sediminis]|uniref:helix-turn-helix transcriptional regulator n=1 Tax=Chachezhania sediminis TaxID=2599291 RepID=UPI00131E23F4|nr:helix-turn-helix transcriptional regulator [Chachezhania sediminis]